VNIQYWYIDGKYNICVAMLINGGKMSFRSLFIRFVPSHINVMLIVDTPILYLSCNKIAKKTSFNNYQTETPCIIAMRSNACICDTVTCPC